MNASVMNVVLSPYRLFGKDVAAEESGHGKSSVEERCGRGNMAPPERTPRNQCFFFAEDLCCCLHPVNRVFNMHLIRFQLCATKRE